MRLSLLDEIRHEINLYKMRLNLCEVKYFILVPQPVYLKLLSEIVILSLSIPCTIQMIISIGEQAI
jgi:hypothetical protein